MRLIGLNAGLVLLATAIVSGCTGEQIVVDDYPVARAVVHGTITDDPGAAVEGAEIEVETWKNEQWEAACPDEGGEPSGSIVDTVSASNGSFTLTLGERGVGPGTRCVVILVSPPAGTSLQRTSDTVPSITLREEPPLDSVRVSLTLPAE